MPGFVTVAATDRDADSPVTVALIDAFYNNVIAALEANTGVPIGWGTGVCFWVPMTVEPMGTLRCNGAAVSRTTYADLFSRLCIEQSGSRIIGTPQITGIADTTRLFPGDYVSGTGIPAATRILTWDSSSQITLDKNATSTGTSLFCVGAWGIGNGTTTFNVPELRGEFVRGWDENRGIDAGRRLGEPQSQTIQSHLHAVGTLQVRGSTVGGTDPDVALLAATSGAAFTIDVNGSTANTGDPETRPRNQAGLWVIKYRG